MKIALDGEYTKLSQHVARGWCLRCVGVMTAGNGMFTIGTTATLSTSCGMWVALWCLSGQG